jgi:hypothetical protein
VHSLSGFGAHTSHRKTWIHKTQHSPGLRQTTTFPLIVYSMPSHGTTPKWHFVPGLPSGRPKIPKIGTPTTFGAHTFVCKPLIEMRSKAKLALNESFPTVCGTPLARKEIGVIPEFWWSRVKLPI